MDPRLLGMLQSLFQEFVKLNENLSIISKRLDKMDINQQDKMQKLIDLFKSDKDVTIV